MQGILLGLADALGYLFDALKILVFINWILWMVQADPMNGIVRFIHAMVDPILAWLRRRLPFLVVQGWDLSAVALYVILLFLDKALVWNLRQYAAHL
jgi:YggT family protein